MDYNIRIPNAIVGKKMRDWTKEEAQFFYEWYLAEIPARIEELRRIYELTGGGSKEDLDLSQGSLIPLWSWFMKNAEIVDRTPEEIEKIKVSQPEYTWQFIATKKITNRWGVIGGFDIASYFASCFLKKYPDRLKWKLFRNGKSYTYYNKPVLVGFHRGKVPMDSMNLLKVNMGKLVDGNSKPEALFNLFSRWEEGIDQE
ncbi:MAG: hypothetical protein Q4A75_09915 [Peptostreptococcaceae bacterium]|nr:hypothetical protein [Peptostreptococcaceae bacterium]